MLMLFSLACESPSKVMITQRNQPLEPISAPTQVADFELRASHTDELIATGLALRPIAQVASPRVEGDLVQATDVVFMGDKLLASYNFRGEPHRGALQIIDVSQPEEPMLAFELVFPQVDLNRIQIYRDRYLVVAAGDASMAATLEIFDLLADAPPVPSTSNSGFSIALGTPRLIASLDLPSRQATMVTLHQDSALVTTGDDGGVALVDLTTPSSPELISYQPLADARYVEVLSDDELLLVSGGPEAAVIRQPWSRLTEGRNRVPEREAPGVTRLALEGLDVGAPSWGFKVNERFHLSADEQGVMTFSLADGGFVETGILPTQGDANAGALSEGGRLALLANGQEGLVALDVQEGHPTQVLARFDTPGDHGSANAIAIRGELVALADGMGGVKLLEARLLRRQGRIANFHLNFVDAGISGELVEHFIHDAFFYTTPTLSPRVLYVLDDYNQGEHPDDPPLTQSILEMLSQELHIIDEPVDGLSPADVIGYDLIWFANPGWYVEDAASVDTLISFSAQGGGIVLQGDDMTHRRTGESLLSELTGLRFINNGTRTCGVRTDNQRGANYEVRVEDQDHPLIQRSAGTVFSYGDDIDHSEPMGVGEVVLAWATLQDDPDCEVRVPAIVAWDPTQSEHTPKPLVSVKRTARLGTELLTFLDGDAVLYDPAQDRAERVISESIFRGVSGDVARNEELDALHYVAETGRYLLSTRTNTHLGQPLIAVRPGDVVSYDPSTDQAQVIFSQDLFRRADGSPSATANIDAVYQDDQGGLYLSTTTSERLGAANPLSFDKGDLIRYDLAQDQATLVLSGSDLYRRSNGEPGAVGDLDAVHLLGEGRFLLSTFASERIGSNLVNVKDGDLIIYDQNTGLASIYLSESIFRKQSGDQGAQADIDALSFMGTH